ncbi:MAG: hypothetical protein ACP5QO_02680 [Clostridia bacterium]
MAAALPAPGGPFWLFTPTSAATTVLGLLQARRLDLPAEEGLPLVAVSVRAAAWGSLVPLAASAPR